MTETTLTGELSPSNRGSDGAIQDFVMKQAIGKIVTAFCVKVVAVHDPDDELIDVMPILYQQAASGDNVDHATIYNVPVARHQRGTSAIIMRPQVGDIGLCIVSTQDISILKKVKNFCKIGTLRRHSYADAIYVMGIFNAHPAQYVEFADNAINIVSPTAINMTAPDVLITGKLTVTEDIMNRGSHVDSTHTHGGVQPGGGTSGVPSN